MDSEYNGYKITSKWTGSKMEFSASPQLDKIQDMMNDAYMKLLSEINEHIDNSIMNMLTVEQLEIMKDRIDEVIKRKKFYNEDQKDD